VNEEVGAQNFLLNYLSSDTALNGLINGVTLRTTWGTLRAPFVKIDKQDAADVMVVSTRRVRANLSFLIRGIDHWTGSGLPDWTNVQAVADRLDTLLHGYEGNNGIVHVDIYRTESFTDETIEGGGGVWLHAGGIYEVLTQGL
jgi:hypothetical protein